uniref:Uncharacterized protein n=1 Tax=Anguilla anguilla TaxID=7936 RepID=A0A0E9Q3P5_ANGAN
MDMFLIHTQYACIVYIDPNQQTV